MSKKEVYESKTEAFVTPILEELSFELVDVDYVKEGPDYYLRVYIDKPGGVTIDDCVTVSRRMNEILDREDYIDEAYIFEVSSPGLGRPLKKEKDYARSMGQELELRTYEAIDGQKEFFGIMTAYDATTVTIQTDSKELTFDRSKLAMIRLAINIDED